MRNEHKAADNLREGERRTPRDSLDDTLQSFLKLYGEAASKDGTPAHVTDAFTQALVVIVGSGPAFAEIEAAYAAQQASGLMMQNAVAMQQKANILGMAMTAKCVRYLLDPKAGPNLDPPPEDLNQ